MKQVERINVSRTLNRVIVDVTVSVSIFRLPFENSYLYNSSEVVLIEVLGKSQTISVNSRQKWIFLKSEPGLGFFILILKWWRFGTLTTYRTIHSDKPKIRLFCLWWSLPKYIKSTQRFIRRSLKTFCLIFNFFVRIEYQGCFCLVPGTKRFNTI